MKSRISVARPDNFAPMMRLARGSATLQLYRRMLSRISWGKVSRLARCLRVCRETLTSCTERRALGGCWIGGVVDFGGLRLPRTWMGVRFMTEGA